ncbi:MAG TPA: signal peptidase I [Streptosporangiaceae bacterium]|nr:signal peptidase I [Streptosporangiaceae bacterium]
MDNERGEHGREFGTADGYTRPPWDDDRFPFGAHRQPEPPWMSEPMPSPPWLDEPSTGNPHNGWPHSDSWPQAGRTTAGGMSTDGRAAGPGSLFEPRLFEPNGHPSNGHPSNGHVPRGAADTMPGRPNGMGPARHSQSGQASRAGAGTRPGGRRKPGRHRARRSWWVELPILLVFALVLALLIKSFVVQAFFIPSSSMEHTLDIGDKVLVSKITYDFRSIQRGDVIVFNGDGSWDQTPAPSPSLLTRAWDSVVGLFGTAPGVHDFIKRVIGIPGDRVVCCNAQHQITVNGVPLSESSYLFPHNAPSMSSFSITVPPGRLWVMGDHRDVSADSRYHMNDPGHGTIPENHVVGRAFMIIAPFSRWRILPIPATFLQPKLLSSSGAAAMLGTLPAPAAPLALGLAGALPLTWLQRRLRQWLISLLRRLLGRGGRPRGRRSPVGR